MTRFQLCHANKSNLTVTLTVTEIVVLRPLLADRRRIAKQVSLLFGARKQIQNLTGMFSVHAEMSLSITAASGLSVTCSSLVGVVFITLS